MKSIISFLPLAFSAFATAQSVYPTNTTLYTPTSLQSTVYLWFAQGDYYSVISPLTVPAVTSLPHGPDDAGGNAGYLYLTDTTQADTFNTQSITFTSCDPADYPGQLTAIDQVNNAVTANVSAIVLYSRSSVNCNITGAFNGYTSFYTASGTGNASFVWNYLKGKSSSQTNYDYAVILTETAYNTNLASTSGGTHGTSTTAIAMIALYAVTGVITILFLIIIVTGAIRAHRHPERYGPRNIIGRARQSRARGIGRAILDTIPIVKFGETVPPKEHGDVELAEGASAPVATEAGRSSMTTGRPSTEQTQHTQKEEARAVAERQNSLSASSTGADGSSGTATGAAAVHIAGEAEEEGQMCSICTEEFNKGEDIRMLPCNHMFHPACVDPWLLDISGTCPLCRIDLNPKKNNTTEEAPTSFEPQTGEASTDPAAVGLAPPLDPASHGRRANLWRTLFGERADSTPQRATPQETVAALRRYREANRTRTADADPATTQHEQQEEQNRRRRFFKRFRGSRYRPE